MDAITEERVGVNEQLVDADRPTSARGPRREPPPWLRRHFRVMVSLDATASALATLLARLWAFGFGSATLHVRSLEIPYDATVLIAVPTWLLVLATSRCYDLGPFGHADGATRRVVRAGAQFLALIAVAYYVLKLERLGRDFLIAIVPMAVACTLGGRLIARLRLRLQRDHGHAMRRALLIGPSSSVRSIAEHMMRHPRDGVAPVAALTPDGDGTITLPGGTVPIVGTPAEPNTALESTGTDLLLITGDLAPGQLRRLTWSLEGTGIDVLVAPTTTQLAGPLLDVRPIAGLPLLYVDQTSIPRQRPLDRAELRDSPSRTQ